MIRKDNKRCIISAIILIILNMFEFRIESSQKEMMPLSTGGATALRRFPNSYVEMISFMNSIRDDVIIVHVILRILMTTCTALLCTFLFVKRSGSSQRLSSLSQIIGRSACCTLFLLLPCSPTTDAQMSPTVVETQYGKLRGIRVQHRHVPPVEQYLGLQFASTPRRRVEVHTPPDELDGREKWEMGFEWRLSFVPFVPNGCPRLKELEKKLPLGRMEHFKRIMPFLEKQSEECLNLNIYVPVRGRIRITDYNLTTTYYLTRSCNLSFRELMSVTIFSFIIILQFMHFHLITPPLSITS